MKKLVIYNHGKDSIPWGEKPLALAAIAKQHGYELARITKSATTRTGASADCWRRMWQAMTGWR